MTTEVEQVFTRKYAESYATSRGYRPAQVDGIPPGFAWVLDGLTVGEFTQPDEYIALIPLTKKSVWAPSKERLLEVYRQENPWRLKK